LRTSTPTFATDYLTSNKHPFSLDRNNLHRLYLEKKETVTSVVSYLLDRAEHEKDDAAWILRLPRDHVLGVAQCLDQQFAADPHGTLARNPLFGLPFGVKDNIDVAGFPTTAGCPRFVVLG
jgi:Asp-tRNA(Asn)/Glu-tRNA(Gln) amidotransferase A subunit family amidase